MRQSMTEMDPRANACYDAAHAIGADGGSLTLPDGSRVTVERWSMNDMARAIGQPWSSFARAQDVDEDGMRVWPDARILAEWNRINGVRP
jgi:hypothetical protein